MDIKYRKAEIEDVPYILDILNSVSGNIKDITPAKFLVATDVNKIMGCIRVKKIGDCYKLASLAVLPDYRRMGIGSSLVKNILGINTDRPIYLFCNIKNVNFYEKFGFKKIEVGNMPDVLQEDYNKLFNSNFAGNTKLLVAMILL